MANTKISALPPVTTVGGADIVPLVQGGVTKSATAAQLLASVMGTNPVAGLSTLKALADAIGDDPTYATDLATTLATKATTAALTAETNRATAAEQANAASIATNTTNVATNTAAIAARAITLTTTPAKTAAYTSPGNEIIPCDTTTAGFTVTLPTAPANTTRQTIKLVASAATVNPVTIAVGGTDRINTTTGPTTATLTLLNQAVTFQYATGVWTVVGDDLPLSQLDLRYATPAAVAATYAPLASPAMTGAPTVNGTPVATQDDANGVAFIMGLLAL